MKTKIRITPEDYLVVLTGAGISAESGVKTFRDSNGLWENHSIEDVATPQAFKRNPQLVWEFYAARLQQLQEVKPNPGHYALTELEEFLSDRFLLITQNIDGLHRAANTKNVLEMHGTIHKSYCDKCRYSVPTESVIARKNENPQWFHCTKCKGSFRPDIIWFGEVPYHLESIFEHLQRCTKFLVIGTSGVVYPAAQFLSIAKSCGVDTIGINYEPPENVGYIDEFHQGLSGVILPQLVADWTK